MKKLGVLRFIKEKLGLLRFIKEKLGLRRLEPESPISGQPARDE